MNKFIIADASPLIAFGRVDQIPLLFDLLGTILIPDIVAAECLSELSRSGATAIQHAIDKGIAEIKPHPTHLHNKSVLLYHLGAGETAAISLAIATQYPLLIDEKLGRKIAKQLQVKIIGTAGILLLAKQKKLLKKISPLLTELQKSGYHLSTALIKEVLQQAGEEHLK
ncbi:MAG: DUF3368 domain-containing protein [Gammaproteobacteria bacterium]|nr:DUF3368 domain-containing protein [Gammaproteobacteria bacterium]